MKHWVFDPRVGDAVESDNPALLAAHLLSRSGCDVDWQAVAETADTMEEQLKVAAEAIAKKAAEYAVAHFAHLFDSSTGEVRISGGPVSFGPRMIQ